ncbi:MAG: acetolactate synthase small subunit [Muricauda sp.]|jgi:acetolactate synthase-1/3 small subunit|uniref:Acetolactate synthase small subunit n=1 Tax=Flagellimonas lutaonensis TaxID=516051 RepID=A0A0D5YVW8_9FLAO|nr:MULTISPECIES: acetolactate synthase small subunit [Allomuricauda]AKA36467.1 acetohydroxyacid synthase small subunit [Allomuricauda lutaonensis]MAU26914.1 acetolactate synthase small subunit [Allomuricauda sp.]MBC29439.1 acetolactate synthase small subunit [Allomuricauda sp.]|tara:strand:+ start:13485 stop:14015 length:531 start_codon:yes stop_codon:yes gene_type:complete
MEKKWYTISVYSENNVGLLNRISGIFLKRHINIESLNVSKSEIEHVSKFTIVVHTTEDWTRKIVQQIEKQIEVIKAFYHTDEETIYQESALFKIASHLLFDEPQIQNVIKESNSTIVTVNREFFVLAKTGRRHEIDEMHDDLEPFGIMQFVRSGRITVTKSKMPITEILDEVKTTN